MKAKAILALSFLVSSAASVPHAHAETKWELRKETSGNLCHIQKSDTQPQRGNVLASDAKLATVCDSAKKLTDPTLSDQKLCWDFDPATVKLCDGAHVTLKTSKKK